MKNILLICLLIFSFDCRAQKYNYVWVTGDDNQFFNSVTGYGGSLIDFNYTPIKMNAQQRELNMYLTNASICDTAGSLLFYTNGCAIAGADDIVLENGYDINPGPFHNLWCDEYEEGYGGGPQNALKLPYPDTQGVYAMWIIIRYSLTQCMIC